MTINSMMNFKKTGRRSSPCSPNHRSATKILVKGVDHVTPSPILQANLQICLFGQRVAYVMVSPSIQVLQLTFCALTVSSCGTDLFMSQLMSLFRYTARYD